MHPRVFEPERKRAARESFRASIGRRRGKRPSGEFHAPELLATGGSAQVWRAIHSSGERVVLKALQPTLAREPGAIELLRREYTLLRDLRHEHIVAAFDLVEFRGAPAIVLEHLGAGDLVSLAGGPPPYWFGAVRDLLAALTYLHGRGIAHRDLKARNVLFDDFNRVRLIDFASAARLGARAPRGGTTDEYRRPGRSAARVGPDEDVFAVAVLLHELIYGRLPAVAGLTAAASPAPEPPWPAGPATHALVDLAWSTLHGKAGSLSRFVDVIESVAAGRL